jgi:hypothetical protein
MRVSKQLLICNPDDPHALSKFDNMATLHYEQRIFYNDKVQRGNLITYDAENCHRFEDALELYDRALQGLEQLSEDIQTEIKTLMSQKRAARLGPLACRVGTPCLPEV